MAFGTGSSILFSRIGSGFSAAGRGLKKLGHASVEGSKTVSRGLKKITDVESNRKGFKKLEPKINKFGQSVKSGTKKFGDFQEGYARKITPKTTATKKDYSYSPFGKL